MLFGTRTFWQSAALATLTCVVLLAAQLVPVARTQPGGKTVRQLRRTVTTRGLNAEDREAQTAGYYQELLNRASDVVARTPGDEGGAAAAGPRPQLEELGANKIEINEHLSSFLIYRPAAEPRHARSALRQRPLRHQRARVRRPGVCAGEAGRHAPAGAARRLDDARPRCAAGDRLGAAARASISTPAIPRPRCVSSSC